MGKNMIKANFIHHYAAAATSCRLRKFNELFFKTKEEKTVVTWTLPFFILGKRTIICIFMKDESSSARKWLRHLFIVESKLIFTNLKWDKKDKLRERRRRKISFKLSLMMTSLDKFWVSNYQKVFKMYQV